MGRKANPAVIGGFVVGAVALAVAGVLIFGGGAFLKGEVSWVSYFPGSVDGLQIGGPVTFKGVKVGQVTDIKVVFDAKDAAVRIPVSWDLDPERVALAGVPEADVPGLREKQSGKDRPLAQRLIRHGLRAQLQLQSFVTGQKIIQLDFFPDTPIELVGGDGDVPEFPTVPPSSEKLIKSIENLPIDELFTDARNALQGIDRLVRDLDSQVVPDARNALQGVDRLVRDLDTQVVPAAQGAFSSIDDMAAARSPVRYELVNALKEFAAAARSIRVLADYLERHPEALVQGKGGPGGNRR